MLLGLFIVLVGLFIVFVGLFIVLVGLFIVFVGLFIVLVGLFLPLLIHIYLTTPSIVSLNTNKSSSSSSSSSSPPGTQTPDIPGIAGLFYSIVGLFYSFTRSLLHYITTQARTLRTFHGRWASTMSESMT